MCKTCSVEGCSNKYLAKGYCSKHYTQLRRYGKILDRTRNDLNEIIEYDDYAEIILYNKQHDEIARAIIDLEYVDSVKKHKWCLNSDSYPYNNQVGYLHQFIMNPPEGLVVDHKNHNRLDNRYDNLRICTARENSMNSGKRDNTSSGVTGVSYYAHRNTWEAYISFNGKRKRLGYFKTIEEAIEARRQAEIKYFGEFAPIRED